MTWALACSAIFGLVGWGAAFVLRGLLAVNRRRVNHARGERDAAKLDLAFATEKLAEFIDRTNISEAKLRARDAKRAAEAAADPKRRPN